MIDKNINKWALRNTFFSLALAIPLGILFHDPLTYFLGAVIGFTLSTILFLIQQSSKRKERWSKLKSKLKERFKLR